MLACSETLAYLLPEIVRCGQKALLKASTSAAVTILNGGMVFAVTFSLGSAV